MQYETKTHYRSYSIHLYIIEIRTSIGCMHHVMNIWTFWLVVYIIWCNYNLIGCMHYMMNTCILFSILLIPVNVQYFDTELLSKSV